MRTLRNIEVPTGNILVVEGEKGKLEMLSLADYGKNVNVKADFMGLTREIEQVKHTKLLPLEDKWVITISTQYGCSMNCLFCDVPKVGTGIDATGNDLIAQVLTGIELHPEVKTCRRLNLHYARMGEPTWNRSVLEATHWLKTYFDIKEFTFHPVVSTMMPKNNKYLYSFLADWMMIKNRTMEGEAGLQLSINSTDEEERSEMFSGNASTLSEIGSIMKRVLNWNADEVVGRKITLNFAVAGWTIDPNILLQYFSPDKYIIKLTPMHKTNTAIENDIKTEGDYTTMYPYKKDEEALKDAGYDVLVFIASEYEDLGRITCGNAILSGSMPEVPYKIIK